MSHSDATTALKIYKTFCRDTEKVVAYLGIAKKLYNVLNVPIPNLKHVRFPLISSPLSNGGANEMEEGRINRHRLVWRVVWKSI